MGLRRRSRARKEKGNMEFDIQKVVQIGLKAGKEVMAIYESGDAGVEKKADDSPLTKADKVSHGIIAEELAKLTPDIPVLSEEGSKIPYERRMKWNAFWCVDPLDGTKEFINRNGEFTINIAFIRDGEPTAGVIYAPAVKALYYARKGEGAFKRIKGKNVFEKIVVRMDADEGLIAVKSRSHSSEEEAKILKDWGVKKSISKGSSLKFCMVAEGRAHVYYRRGPTMEWDTAAGHAIAACAGAYVEGLAYNKKSLKNDSFIVSSVKLEIPLI